MLSFMVLGSYKKIGNLKLESPVCIYNMVFGFVVVIKFELNWGGRRKGGEGRGSWLSNHKSFIGNIIAYYIYSVTLYRKVFCFLCIHIYTYINIYMLMSVSMCVFVCICVSVVCFLVLRMALCSVCLLPILGIGDKLFNLKLLYQLNANNILFFFYFFLRTTHIFYLLYFCFFFVYI